MCPKEGERGGNSMHILAKSKLDKTSLLSSFTVKSSGLASPATSRTNKSHYSCILTSEMNPYLLSIYFLLSFGYDTRHSGQLIVQ